MKITNLIFVILTSMALLFSTGTASAKVIDEHVRIIPVGQIDNKIMEGLKSKLVSSFPQAVSIEVDPGKELPQNAYDEARKQYNAQIILDSIARQIGIDTTNESALVVVDVDLYDADKSFVFGLADKKKGICIVSLTRLKNEFYNLPQDNLLLIERGAKESLYELGNYWAVEDCPSVKCVMHYADTIQGIDKKGSTFCRKCRDTIHSRYMKPFIKTSLKPFL